MIFIINITIYLPSIKPHKILTAKQISETFDKESDLLMYNIDELKEQYNSRLAAIIDELNAEKYSELIITSGNLINSY